MDGPCLLGCFYMEFQWSLGSSTPVKLIGWDSVSLHQARMSQRMESWHRNPWGFFIPGFSPFWVLFAPLPELDLPSSFNHGRQWTANLWPETAAGCTAPFLHYPEKGEETLTWLSRLKIDIFTSFNLLGNKFRLKQLIMTSKKHERVLLKENICKNLFFLM